MAIKYKQDKNNEFKSIDRDIREHELEGSDFDLMLTDSTCPFKSLIKYPAFLNYQYTHQSSRNNRFRLLDVPFLQSGIYDPAF